jgi:hypothetical protein
MSEVTLSRGQFLVFDSNCKPQGAYQLLTFASSPLAVQLAPAKSSHVTQHVEHVCRQRQRAQMEILSIFGQLIIRRQLLLKLSL